MILHDELDIALVNMEMYNIDKMDSCILLHDKLVFCVAENHALAHKESITVEDLNHEKIILFNKDSVQNTLLKSFQQVQQYHINLDRSPSEVQA